MSESVARRKVIAALKCLDAVSVENTIHRGTPDINFVEGWIELKYLNSWPKKAHPKFAHFQSHQRAWIKRRARRGGKVYVLLCVGTEWILIDGVEASDTLGKVSVACIRENAIAIFLSDRDMKKQLAKALSDEQLRRSHFVPEEQEDGASQPGGDLSEPKEGDREDI